MKRLIGNIATYVAANAIIFFVPVFLFGWITAVVVEVLFLVSSISPFIETVTDIKNEEHLW